MAFRWISPLSIRLHASTRLRRGAGIIRTTDTEGHEGRVRVDAIRPGDRVRIARDLVLDTYHDDDAVYVNVDTVGEVHTNLPSVPAVAVIVRSTSGDVVQDRLLTIPVEDLVLLVSSDDPRG